MRATLTVEGRKIVFQVHTDAAKALDALATAMGSSNSWDKRRPLAPLDLSMETIANDISYVDPCNECGSSYNAPKTGELLCDKCLEKANADTPEEKDEETS